MHRYRFVLFRPLQFLPVLFGISVITFVLVRLIDIGFDPSIFTAGRLQVIQQRRKYFEGVILAFANEYSNPPCPSNEAIRKMLEKLSEKDATPAFEHFEREVHEIDRIREQSGPAR